MRERRGPALQGCSFFALFLRCAIFVSRRSPAIFPSVTSSPNCSLDL